MTRDELAISLQLAIGQLTLALGNISQVKDVSINNLSEPTLSLESDTKTSDIVVWQDQAIFLGPERFPLDEFRNIYARGRPPGLPTRTCPTCSGKGKI